MIRVAHLLPNLAIGGRERIVADLCHTAEAQGIAPIIITYDPLPAGAATIAVDAPLVALDRRDPAFGTRLRAAVAAHRVDLVHAQGHVPAALLPPLEVPHVVTLHVALGSGWRWLPAIRRGLRSAAAVTAVSDDLRRRFAFVAGRRPEVIATGVDLARFAPVPRVHGVFTIGIAARLHPIKRHRDALDALRLLAARGVRLKLLIAGDGPETGAIARRAEGLDVEMLGAVEDMPGFYARCDAAMLVSDHEGTPAALAEAMACGLPIVATAVGGVPALIGEAGLLVPRRNPAAIADALVRLVTDPALRASLAAEGIARARALDIGVQATAYRAVYARALGACAAPPFRFRSGV